MDVLEIDVFVVTKLYDDIIMNFFRLPYNDLHPIAQPPHDFIATPVSQFTPLDPRY